VRGDDDGCMTQTLDLASTRYGDLIARAVRICNDALVMDRNGHVSQRDESDPNVFWINNRHASRSTLTAADIVPFDIRAGRRVGEGIEAPSEWHIHREIYRRRPDVGGIVHSHPVAINALSCVGQRLRPLIPAGAFVPEDGAPVFDSAVLINSEARGIGMADAMGDALVVVLRQHGTVIVGGSAQEAVTRMIGAEDNARMQLQAIQIGTPTYFKGEELKVMRSEQGGPHGVLKSWHYAEETAGRNGALEGLS
jgi:ribulose-5-phosphate 4-epimerase/fuculose-1-phosphate aldolase